MKSEEYVLKMLQRAEANKRKALKDDDDKKLQIQAGIIRNLKIVLEVPKNLGRQRLRKDKEDMDRLLKE